MSRGSLNKVQIIGNLGRDPEMRYTPDGKAVTTFSVATGGKWQDRDGNERDDTEWFRVEAWDKLAETCNSYLNKGTKVYIEGRLKTRKWQDKETGQDRYSTDLVANNMIILSSRNNGNGGGYDSDVDEEMAPPPPARNVPARAASESRAPVQAPARNAAPAARPAAPAARPTRNQPQPIDSEDDIPF